jgi:hypothetical protein
MAFLSIQASRLAPRHSAERHSSECHTAQNQNDTHSGGIFSIMTHTRQNEIQRNVIHSNAIQQNDAHQSSTQKNDAWQTKRPK